MWHLHNLPAKKLKDHAEISRWARKRLSPAELGQLERYNAMLKSGALEPEKAEAVRTLARMTKKGKLGTESEFLLKRTKTGNAIATLTERSDRGAAYIPNLGAWGVLVHALGITTIARVHAYRKRKEVLKAVETQIKAQQHDNLKTIVFSVSRFLHQNNELRHTAIYDPKAERAVYELFGRLGEKSKGYSKKFPRPEKQAMKDYGQQYFRSLVRNSLISDFGFLQRHHADPAKMDALKYGLVGHNIDPLTEAADLERLKFITDIFRKDVSEINRFHGKAGQERAIQAIIRIRWKAQQSSGTQEAVKFFYQVCDYYKINPKEVDHYATSIYWNTRKLARPQKPTGKPSAERLREYEMGCRVARAREKELKERIEQIYGKEALQRYKPRELKESDRINAAWSEREAGKTVILPLGGARLRPSRK